MDQHFDTQCDDAFVASHMKIHAEQSMFTRGDSGGPLFLRNQTNKFVLAGIASNTHSFQLDRGPCKRNFFIIENEWTSI